MIFSCDRLTNFEIVSHDQLTDFSIFSSKWLMNFAAVFPRDRLMNFAVFFFLRPTEFQDFLLQLIDKCRDIFPITDWRISLYFLKINWLISWGRLTNFAIFPFYCLVNLMVLSCDRLVKITDFFSQPTKNFVTFFSHLTGMRPWDIFPQPIDEFRNIFPWIIDGFQDFFPQLTGKTLGFFLMWSMDKFHDISLWPNDKI